MGSAVASSGGAAAQTSAALCPTSQPWGGGAPDGGEQDARQGEAGLLEQWRERVDALFAPAAPRAAGQDAAKLRTIREEEEDQEPVSALQTVMSSVPTLYDSVTTVFGTSASDATVYGPGGSRAASSSAGRREGGLDDAGQSPLASMVSSSVFSSFGSADPFKTISGTSRLRQADLAQTAGRRRRKSDTGPEPGAGAGQEAGAASPLMSALSSVFSSSPAAAAGVGPAPTASAASSQGARAPCASGSSGPLGSQQSVAGSLFSNLGGGLFSSKTTKAQALTQQQGAFFVQAPTQEVVETEDRQLTCCCHAA